MICYILYFKESDCNNIRTTKLKLYRICCRILQLLNWKYQDYDKIDLSDGLEKIQESQKLPNIAGIENYVDNDFITVGMYLMNAFGV